MTGPANMHDGDTMVARARRVLGGRKTSVMLALGFAAGFPNVMLIGTLNAWLSAAGVDLATIGVLSWIGLAYAFKFLWSPAVNLSPPLGFGRLGRRRGWMLICQIVITACIAVIAVSDPEHGLGLMAAAATLAAFASATQDISIDTWRIEAADKAAPLDLLSAVYQFGYRTSSLAGGAGALFLADQMAWSDVYLIAALVMALAATATLFAPEPARDLVAEEKSHAVDARTTPQQRLISLGLVLSAWAVSIYFIVDFMILAVTSEKPPAAAQFTREMGPWIVAATVIFPCALAAWLSRLSPKASAQPGHRSVDRLYGAIVTPFVEIMSRLGLAAILVVFLILTYRITDSIWGPFAFPFYLQELQYTNSEVAFASKLFGVIMTIAGVGLGAICLVVLGRMASLTLGAAIAAASNLLFADLAYGGPGIDAVLTATGLDGLFAWFGADLRMARLMIAITGENIAAGFAGAAFVAYLSSLASRLHGAVQFAVFTSLTLLVGTLGRGWIGEEIKEIGYGPVFEITAMIGIVAVIACIFEWMRTPRAGNEAKAAA